MRKIAVWLGCYLLVSFCGAEIRDGVKYGISKDDPVFQKSYPQRKELKRHGGIATIILTVKDEKGVPIQGAEGNASFWYKNGSVLDKSISNETGKLTLSNKVTTDGLYGVGKEGFYYTRGYVRSFDAPDEPFGFFERRRWKPVIRDAILKKKRNPIPMYSRMYCGPLPAINQPIGFDLKIVDWVKPHGRGENVDMVVTVTTKETRIGRKTFTNASVVTFDFPGDHNGVQVCDSDGWSRFISAYHVNLQTPFQKQLVMQSNDDRYKWLDKRKHLVFRVRSEVSPTGELLRCHYGKIYPTFDITSEEFALHRVFFNPTPNDTNLEFDPKRNLSPFKTFEEEQTLNRGTP